LESVFVRLSFLSNDRYADITLENLGLDNVFKWLFHPIILKVEIENSCPDNIVEMPFFPANHILERFIT